MSEHQYEFIKKRLAPCGLHCGKCFAFTEGDICNQSNRLKESLGSFYDEFYILGQNDLANVLTSCVYGHFASIGIFGLDNVACTLC